MCYMSSLLLGMSINSAQLKSLKNGEINSSRSLCTSTPLISHEHNSLLPCPHNSASLKHLTPQDKSAGATLSSLHSILPRSYLMTNEPCETTFPFLVHTCRVKATRPTEGWMAGPQNYCISFPFAVIEGALDDDCLQKLPETELSSSKPRG